MNRIFVRRLLALGCLMILVLSAGGILSGCGGTAASSANRATGGRLVFVLKDNTTSKAATQNGRRRAVPRGTKTFRVTITQQSPGAPTQPVWDVPIGYDETNPTHPFRPANYTNNLTNGATATGDYQASDGLYHVQLPEVPLDNLLIVVRVYNQTAVIGSDLDAYVPTASFETQKTLSVANKVQIVTIDLNSTVDHFDILPHNIPELVAGGAQVQLSATPLDSKGNNVFVDPSQIQWSSSDPTIASIDAQKGILTPGYIGTNPIVHPITHDVVGAATITVVETGFTPPNQPSNSIQVYTRINVVLDVNDKPLSPPTLGSKHTFHANVYGLLPNDANGNAVAVQTGNDPTIVKWTLTNADGSAVDTSANLFDGSIAANGDYSAPTSRPANPGATSKSYKVTATSVKDPNQLDSSTFSVQVGSTSISIN